MARGDPQGDKGVSCVTILSSLFEFQKRRRRTKSI
jgi:hypothetical protein